MDQQLAAVVLAAGKGSRLVSDLPKVLHPVCGHAMLSYPLAATRHAGFSQIKLVVGHGADLVQKRFLADDIEWVIQGEQLGTGHALKCAETSLRDYRGPLLLVCGDVPLLQGETLKQLLECHQHHSSVVTVLTAEMQNPTGYGRIIRDGEQILSIIEERDADQDQRKVTEVNTGTYVFDAEFVFDALKGLNQNNAQGEYYLTDVVAAAVAAGKLTRALVIEDADDAMGVNDRCQLAESEILMRRRINNGLMRAGVSMTDPATVYAEKNVEVGMDTCLHPNVHLKGNTRIGKNCIIEPGVVVCDSVIGDNVHLKSGTAIEEAIVGPGCKVGPMAHLRPGTELVGDNKIGNFVETKKARFDKKSQASHLTYIGDAEVGQNVNFGCGTITCNYDGVNKHKTIVEDDVFVGSDTQFVAPVTIGRNSLIGAGSTITKDVPEGALAVSRTRQQIIKGWNSQKTEKS